VKIVFLFPFINEYFGGPVKWLPLSTSILTGYLKRHFPEIVFHQFDLEEEIKRAIETGKFMPGYSEMLNQFLIDEKYKMTVENKDLKKDSEKFKNFFDDLVAHVGLKDYNAYFFAVYNRNKAGIRANLLLARYLKEKYKNKKIIFGGIYGFGRNLSNSPLEQFDFIDSFIPAQGRGEIPAKEIIESLCENRNFERYYFKIPPLSQEEFRRELPDFKSFRSLKYFLRSRRELEKIYGVKLPETSQNKKIVFVPYRFSQGCFWARCAYCARSGRSSEFDSKDIKTIIQDLIELKEAYRTKYFIFFNSNFNSNLNFAKDLLKAFIKNRLDILWTDSFNLRVMDEELIDLLIRAGCFRADIGITTLNPTSQKLYNNILQENKNLENMKKMAQKGIWTHINLIANLPHQYSLTVEKTILKKYMDFIDGVTLNNYRPYPSSDLVSNYEKYNLKWVDLRQDGEIAIPFLENDFCGTQDERRKMFSSNFEQLNSFLCSFDTLRNSINWINLYLLGYLYNALGFRQKNEIKKILNNAKLKREIKQNEKTILCQPA
jgi:hypothetical protein